MTSFKPEHCRFGPPVPTGLHSCGCHKQPGVAHAPPLIVWWPLQVIIAGAGGAAHLPGMVAALTPLPVIGVPVKPTGAHLDGIDALLSIVQACHHSAHSISTPHM